MDYPKDGGLWSGPGIPHIPDHLYPLLGRGLLTKMRQNLTVAAPHALESVIRPATGLNPVALLPEPELDPPIHDCLQVLAEAHG